MVLCDCRKDINPSKIPPEIMPISGGSQWKAVYYTEPQFDKFEDKLLTFLLSEGKTLADIQGLCTPTQEGNSNPEDIIRAVCDVMSRTNNLTATHTDLCGHFLGSRGERLSEFLRRLERSLVKIVQGGGLSVSAANSARLEQLIR